MKLRPLASITVVAALLAGPSMAQDFGTSAPAGSAGQAAGMASPVTSTQSAGNAVTFTLRGGVSAAPKFLGSDEYEAGPDIGFSFKHLRLRGVPEIGDDDPWTDGYGWDVHGSFRYLGKRDSSSESALKSLDDIDPTYEVGLGVGYTAEQFEAFADIRRGFGGHEGYVGSVGIDYVARPSDRWKLTLGPRFIWADDEFLDTYSGIDPDEATASLPAYDPDGGLVSAGLQFGARYQVNDLWGVEGAVTWDNLQGDAADSPIVDEGSNDQFRVRVGVTRVFNLRF